MSLQLPFSVKVVNPKPVDYYYMNDGVPYADVAEANSLIHINVRYLGMTVNVNKEEYWYREGLGDSDLVLKINASVLTYTHNQGSAAQIWYIVHNLNKRPAIHCEDMSGNEIIPQIIHTDNNNAQAHFGNATYSGTAHCN